VSVPFDGSDWTAGRNLLTLPDGDTEVLPAKVTREVPPGTTVTVETPGGGGHGEPES